MGRVTKLRIFPGPHGHQHYDLEYQTDAGDLMTAGGMASYSAGDHLYLRSALNSFVKAEYETRPQSSLRQEGKAS